MKKTTLAIALAFGVASAFAQDLTSKKGEPILPEADDWSIGIDASPFLNYAGQLLSSSGASSPDWNFLNNNWTIVGKMFKDEKTAYRAILRIGMDSKSWVNMVSKDFSTANFPTVETVEDKLKMGRTFIGLGGGLEMRRGKTRLQGYYGGDAMFWMSSQKATMTYGNAMSATNTASTTSSPTSTTWTPDWTNFTATSSTGSATARTTEWKSGTTIGLGVRGFIGAEYFILPKISVGAEFGWGIAFSSTGGSSTTTQTTGVDAGGNAVLGDVVVEGGKSGSFMIDTDRNMFGTGSGTLRMNLHF
jgi:hypothetical protein